MITFLIKSTLAMGVLLGLYYILFEKEKMHRFNRFYLLTALIFSLALPFVNIPIYVETDTPQHPVAIEQGLKFSAEQNERSEMPARAITTASVQKPEKPQVNYWPHIGWSLYLLVVTVLSIRFLVNILHFYRLKRNNLTISYRGVSLVLLNTEVLPHTFLSNIYLNKYEFENKKIATSLFLHEYVHVKQNHTLDILLIETLKTIFWFNPLLHFYKKAIQLNHEFLADGRVIASANNAAQYQSLLLEKATHGRTFSIASNFNFALTKKRFLMMTKTTSRSKSRTLKVTVLPTIAGLLYFLSTETVLIAKTTNNPLPVRKELNASGSASYSRLNEYYAGVQITIDDAKEGKYINKPYEMLTLQERQQYLPEAPEKVGNEGISDEDYEYAVNIIYNYEGGGLYYIDDKKVSREEILKHKKADFVNSAIKSRGATMVNGKLVGDNQIFFYTNSYYNKYLKHVNDHYPDKNLKISITKNPGKESLEMAELSDEEKASGKNYQDITTQKRKKELAADYYPTIEKIKDENRILAAHFPGGQSKFDEYVDSNIDFKNKPTVINFTVNTDGTISNVSLRHSKDKELITKVKRVFENSPKWIPAQKNGKAYLISYSMEFFNQ